MKCLVVDDSAITRRILVHSLRASGFGPILEATDGKQALQMLDGTVDIVLTDWNMPGMGGIEMVRNMRANPAFAKLPVVLITSRSVREDVVEAAKAGVNGYVVKPFTPETLRNKIEEVVRAGSEEPAAEHAPAAGPAKHSEHAPAAPAAPAGHAAEGDPAAEPAADAAGDADAVKPTGTDG